MFRKKIVINEKKGKSVSQNWGNGIEDKSTTIVNIFVMSGAPTDEIWEKVVKQVNDNKANVFLF